jgi:hypothetical protein
MNACYSQFTLQSGNFPEGKSKQMNLSRTAHENMAVIREAI